MEEIKMYRAADGLVFDNPGDCMNHENAMLELMEHAMAIKNYCEKMENCENCPLWNKHQHVCTCDNDLPANWG